MKVCVKCAKDNVSFYKDKNAADGYRNVCKACDIERRIKWHKNNKTKDSASRQKYAFNNKEKIKKQLKQLELNEPGYYARKAKESRTKRGDTYKAYRRDYDKTRRLEDPLYKLRRASSNRISSAIIKSGFRKTSKVSVMLGCSWIFFKDFIQAQFELNMSWTNYGINGWTIDHICPCSQAQTEEELIKLQHYSNLQPSFHNFTKSDKATAEAILKCKELLGRDWI